MWCLHSGFLLLMQKPWKVHLLYFTIYIKSLVTNNTVKCSIVFKVTQRHTDTTALIAWFSECPRLLRNVKHKSQICVKRLGEYLMVRLSLQDINKWFMWLSCLSVVMLCVSSFVKILTDVFLLLWGWCVSSLPCSPVVPFSPNLYLFWWSYTVCRCQYLHTLPLFQLYFKCLWSRLLLRKLILSCSTALLLTEAEDSWLCSHRILFRARWIQSTSSGCTLVRTFLLPRSIYT